MSDIIMIAREIPSCGSCPLRTCVDCKDWCVPAQRVLGVDDYEHHPDFCPIRKAPAERAQALEGDYAVGWNHALRELGL